MSATGAPEITVENHLVRFVPMNPVDGQIAIKKLGAKESGDFVIHLLDKPRATILIDKQGRIVIHGTRRVATARAAVREFMLRLGESDEGLSAELGTIIASFNFNNNLNTEAILAKWPNHTSKDSRIDCVRLNDDRHELELLIWSNGKVVALKANHANLVAMSAIHWRGKFDEEGIFVASPTKDD